MSNETNRTYDSRGSERGSGRHTPALPLEAPVIDPGARVSDVMLWEPKTLPATATVEEVRGFLACEHSVMALLTDGPAFRGAITEIPETAAADAPALAFADPTPAAIALTESATSAFSLAAASLHRRLIVLDRDGSTLVGLVCVSTDGRRFCKHAGRRGARRS